MNNEPVAWMKEVEGGTMYTNYEYPGSIPLYTHTAKTLTDEEIIEVWNTFERTDNIPIVDFAKALRKAQKNGN
jgi:hypothetical protein